MPMTAEAKLATPTELPPRLALFQMITWHYVSRAIYVAAKLGIADLLASGTRHYNELATSAGFELSRILPVEGSLLSVLEGVRV